MKTEDIAKFAQTCFQGSPTIVLGSGASMPHGLRSVGALSDYLRDKLETTGHAEEEAWLLVRTALANGDHLEAALEGKAFHGKLSRLIGRLEAKRHDRRLAFLFQPPNECMEMEWLERMVHAISTGRGAQDGNEGGIKIIDFSEVPSDVLPLMVSLLAQIIFSTSLWTKSDQRHPIALMCDEAHLYIPERMNADSSDAVAVEIFERIAKEGRKYGIGLVVISQRPSEVNRTVLSQCNNVVAMRLTNGDDQSVIKRLLPDSLGSFGDLLPVLDIGEALVVGDASLLPTRVRIAEPKMKPDSQTVAFWDRWNDAEPKTDTPNSIRSWRRQSMN